ncbi:uncharacterized protein LOC105444763 [Strongylocentrotus purpuratus]|uniref:Sushi domain-containing protein n=1 Tax=Strongylocentrotus purpuratus TaxID=7668 RepID=A0A7M7SVM1_STRPU|nr:uncharacterized protein LOC105444763 [Strongylocentrotus purpuratus]
MCPNNTFEVDNATDVTVTSQEYRGVAVYTCSPAYLPDASPVSNCQADGTWSNPNFTCFAMTTPPTEPQTGPLSTSSKPDALSSTSPSPSAGEISTQPSEGEPQPKPNVAAIAGGISATLIVIILLILAVALARKRKRPSSKNGQEMILGNEQDLKPEANNYSIVDNRKPVTTAGTDNRAFAGDTTGNGHVNVIVQSEPETRNAPSEDETQFVGADIVENALYGANESASGQGSRDGTPNVQLLGVAARYVVTDDLPIPNVQLEGALSKSIPTYGRVDKSQSQMVENELYGETDGSDRHQMYEKTGIDLKDSPNLQTEMNSAPNDGMVDNELYALSPDDATYQEVEENGQEVIFEEDNDSMIDNALYSASDVTGHVGREGGTVYQNAEYHDVPDYLADNELYNMK